MRAVFIDPGALRTEFALEQATVAPDGMGGHTESWSEVATVFGRIEPVTAQSVFGAGQTLETATHRITTRFREDIGSGMRLARAGRMFAIITVHDPDETGRYLICRVREEGR